MMSALLAVTEGNLRWTHPIRYSNSIPIALPNMYMDRESAPYLHYGPLVAYTNVAAAQT